MGLEEDNVFYPKWERIIFAIGTGTIILGIILKYNGSRMSSYFLMAGIIISLVSYFMGLFSKKGLED